jgi:hypothetical protein
MTVTDSPEWLAAKAAGDDAELIVAEWFRTKGYDVFRTLGQVSFDLLLQTKIEVKRDRRAASTGNVAVEVAYRGRSSGVHDSQAAFWAFVLDAEILLVPTRALRDLIASSEFVERVARDGRQAVVKLVPVATLRGHREVRVIPNTAKRQPRGKPTRN